LRLRKNQENLVQKDFAMVNTHLITQQERLEYMRKVRKESKEDYDRNISSADVNSLVLYDDFFSGIQIQKNTQNKIIEEISIKAEAKRKDLTESMRKRRTLEILKEREQAAFKKKQLKMETAELDEIAAVRHFSNR
jgi:flagellar export protein FliJ